jgi:23S rRNA (uracil1939-C5)-methyltransferase
MTRLKAFAEKYNIDIYLQSGGLDSVVPLDGITPRELSYALTEFDVTLNFLPTDFTQVNLEINRAMVPRALELLEVNSEDRVLDLFCGIGNFTLPLARRAASVLGIEGDQGLVERAKQNAALNNINNVEFRAMDLARDDLNEDFSKIDFFRGGFNKLLLDPARNGAQEVIEKMNLKSVERIVYVACNPSTLARDAGILVNDKGFKLEQAGVMDMFPHTTHVESIAVFSRKRK